jgi:hypothetical protein
LFFYPRPAGAFQSTGLADLLSFGGASVSLMPGADFTVLAASYSNDPTKMQLQ